MGAFDLVTAADIWLMQGHYEVSSRLSEAAG